MSAPVFPFPPGTRPGVLLRREKRFLVEVELGGERLWAHTNNSGSMLGLVRRGTEALLSPAANPKRRLPYTLEAVAAGGGWCSVNTLAPNRLLAWAFAQGLLPELAGATAIRPEARSGESRLDARFETPDGPLWVECKNVTLAEDGAALFPDARTERGRKHLEELMRLCAQGARVATFYLVTRADAACFGPAWCVDEDYARAFYAALDAGVEAWPWLARVDEAGIRLTRRLAVVAP
ncbi:Sugar fermentation stimulation protein A [Desulfovibrio sp. X2]|uniref:DNA/RNA nuclease SfsA n=1 Tax=Desulfovibrio sp. X2 TaxID=941449 RepID=UPI000358A362|nr:DNA/RNA nuclease SfsA [Desulfovibrio sp. X2]EPR44681.1 Sugar fermentation stimulation protein A [Desulfovibrio sp. X2]